MGIKRTTRTDSCKNSGDKLTMRILITGATGFIGHRLVTHLQYKHKLVALSRKPAIAYQRLGHNLQAIGSLEQFDDLDAFDAIINLAGEPIANKRWTTHQKQKISQSRLQLIEQLKQRLNASKNPPHTIISGSAIGYYGHLNAEPVDEFSSISASADFAQQLCEQWEQAALSMQSEQTRVCLLRTGIVLGREGGALAKMLPAFKWGVGGPLGNGQQYMSWIHIHDTINAILFLLHHPKCQGAYNLTAPSPVSNNEFTQCLAKTLQRPAAMRLPAPFLKLVFGEMAQLLVAGQNVVPTRLEQAGFDFKFSLLENALRELLHDDSPGVKTPSLD
jgi:uncharacterized protein (TIGR01777 family)